MADAISVVAIIQAKAGAEQAIESAIRACVLASRQEAGCLSYVAHRDLEVAGRFVFVERWASRAALAAHEKEPHFQALGAALAGKTAAPLSVSILSALD